MRVAFASSFFLALLPFGSGFNANPFDVKMQRVSDLYHLTEIQTEQRISLSLDIAEPKATSRLAVNGIEFDLTDRVPTSKDDFVRMPVSHGPFPQLSGGFRALTNVGVGSFTSMRGREIVALSKGCWEIAWRDGAPCGSLLYGFEVDREHKRNDATLPKGTVYVSFSTWTSEGLERAREIRESKAAIARKASQKRDEEVVKMVAAQNVFRKAHHYFNALAAADEAYAQPLNSKLKHVPTSGEAIRLVGDLRVSAKGKVWTQNLPYGKPVFLGEAKMKSVVPKDRDE